MSDQTEQQTSTETPEHAAPASEPPATEAPPKPEDAGGQQSTVAPAAAATQQAAPELGAELSAQIDAAMEASAPPAAQPKIRGPRVVGGAPARETRTGRVVNVTDTDVFLEFGPKDLGIVPRDQWREGENVPQVDQSLEVLVDRYDEKENINVCSRPGAIRKAVWDQLRPGMVIEATCTGTNKGGLEMELAGGHRAFLPASQAALERIEDLSTFVGQKLECEVQRVERRGGGNVVLSRRAVLERERAKAAEALKDTLAPGQKIEGVVRRVAPFGAFVDIGGIDGLVHVSDLSHNRIGQGENAVRKVVSEGQRVRVEVLKVDWDNNRISLGMKQLEADPFSEAQEKVEEGAELSGRVTKILEFGAFVEVAPGVEGLVHISELDHKRVRSVGDAVSVDEVVKVKVLGIDHGKRRISLSIKALKEPPAGQRGRGERGPSADEILKETPALRRLREKFGGNLKGGLG
ncbi:MAG: S1 RNA-binding domain-containing protein [Planctomycetota bacterium]